MYTRYGLEMLKRQVAERKDDSAMRSACGEYNCDCHDLVPKLLDDLLRLHETVESVQQTVDRLPVGFHRKEKPHGDNTTTREG